MSTHDVRYKERTPWPHWADALFWGALLITSFATLAGLDSDLPDPVRVPFAAGILAFGLIFGLVGAFVLAVAFLLPLLQADFHNPIGWAQLSDTVANVNSWPNENPGFRPSAWRR